MERKAFLDQPAPAGYIAGIGRGATGFTTSAEVGSASRITPLHNDNDDDNDDDEVNDNSNQNNEMGLLRSSKSTNDDLEADEIYAQVEKQLKRRKTHNKLEVAKNDSESNLIRNQFLDLKKALSSVNEFQWENLPEAGDITKKNKRQRLLEKSQQRYYAAPDALISGTSDGTTDFQSISKAKDKLLSNQLDSFVKNSGSDINLDEIDEDENMKLADINKGRMIFASLRKTEPSNVNAWIASAKLEEQAHKFEAAREIITEACDRMPKNEQIWLESIRIHQLNSEGYRMSKKICQQALRYNPNSEKLWLKAVNLENPTDIMSKKKILMKGLESLPSSASLWKEIVELETDSNDVKKFLEKAITLCPTEWEFWTSLINLCDYEESKKIINRARKAMNNNHKVWVVALKLEERENANITQAKLIKIMQKAFKELGQYTEISDSFIKIWIEEASIAEHEQFYMSCEAIIHVCLDMFELPLQESLGLAENYKQNGSSKTATFIYQKISEKNPESFELWVTLFGYLKETKNYSLLYTSYDKAISLNPEISVYYLMKAKDKWILEKNVIEARSILIEATSKFESDESVWFARIKFEIREGNIKEASNVSSQALDILKEKSARAWYKHIHIQRYLNQSYETLMELCDDGIGRFPSCSNLYLQKGQIQIERDDLSSARETISIGLRYVPHSVLLWDLLLQIDNKTALIRARATVDKAMLQNSDNPAFSIMKIKLERQVKDFDTARQTCNKALKKFPSSPEVWIQNLYLISKPSQRRNAFIDALKNTNNSAIVLMNIGLFFWMDAKFSKAKSWLERSITNEQKNGDCWAWWYKFNTYHGSEAELKQVKEAYLEAFENINQGEVWNKLKKSPQNLLIQPLKLLDLVSNELASTSDIITFK